MIAPTASGRSDATRQAELIYAEARSQIDVRLWRAALGSGVEATPAARRMTSSPLLGIAALTGFGDAAATVKAAPSPALPLSALPGRVRSTDVGLRPPELPATVLAAAGDQPAPAGARLGANAGYSSAIADAARRNRLPAAALASIIDAEAAKDKAGVWQPGSRNARSSATGLGQFLSGTWKSEAQRAGTWLNGVARRNGWLGATGAVLPEMQSSLMALRQDADASINATADYARHSLDKLAAAGAVVGTGVEDIARAAYLGHNLGLGDAVRFLKGGLDDSRARRLLDAQVGSAGANRRTVAAGGAAAAHRGWLLDFMARHVNASRFSS